MKRLTTTLCLLALLGCFSTTVSAAPILHGPSGPYLSFANDSPFASTLAAGEFAYFHLEDFEDGLGNTPGLTLPPGSIGLTTNNVFVDSVAEDKTDGEWGSGFATDNVPAQPFTFSFDAVALGTLPTHVGIVVTDIQIADPQIFGGITTGVAVTVEAFGPGGVSLGSVTDPNYGTFNTTGEFSDDIFFGFFDAGGIESINLSALWSNPNDQQVLAMEFDHIQYGATVPEPSSFILWSVAALGLGFYARRRKRKTAA